MMNFPSNSAAGAAENLPEGQPTRPLKVVKSRALNAFALDKGSAMSVAVIPADGTEPVATFPDMATAMAWGLQQYKGHPFVVRVFADGAHDDIGDSAAPSMPLAQRRPPTAKAAAVANVLRTARKAAQEEFRVEERLKLRAAAH